MGFSQCHIPVLCFHVAFWKEGSMKQLMLSDVGRGRGAGLCSSTLRAWYPHELFRILLFQLFMSAQACADINSYLSSALVRIQSYMSYLASQMMLVWVICFSLGFCVPLPCHPCRFVSEHSLAFQHHNVHPPEP